MQDREAPITHQGKTPEEKLEIITIHDSVEGWKNFIDCLFQDWLVCYDSDMQERDHVLAHVIQLNEFFNTLKD
jgi:hypothetical protein